MERMKEKILYGVISVLMAAGLLAAVPAFAQSTQQPPQGEGNWGGRGGMMHGAPGVFGTVSAIAGDSITLQSKAPEQNATATTYTVDATNATVMKGQSTSTVSAIAVGDTLMVQGTVSGDSVTATTIRDGMPARGTFGQHGMASSTQPHMPSLKGNGEPVVGGSVTAISGDTLTVTNKSNVTYTVDATNATVLKGNATSSVASISTGDNVLVQGTINGNAVTASSVIDQGTAPTAGSGNGSGAPAPMHGFGGMFGVIGGFFQHLFGFF